MQISRPLPRILLVMVLFGATACTRVSVGGAVSEGAPSFDPVANAIVTYTSTSSLITYNDTSVASGIYQIEMPEGEYLIQATHPTCNLTPAVQMITMTTANSPYTANLFMSCP